MITRIIRLTLKISHEEFTEYINKAKDEFDKFEGCEQIEILKDKIGNNVYFIYTIWKSNKHLNKFRKSEFNKKFWNTIVDLSQNRPQVWSVENIFEK